jgi:hypothetical protein
MLPSQGNVPKDRVVARSVGNSRSKYPIAHVMNMGKTPAKIGPGTLLGHVLPVANKVGRKVATTFTAVDKLDK